MKRRKTQKKPSTASSKRSGKKTVDSQLTRSRTVVGIYVVVAILSVVGVLVLARRPRSSSKSHEFKQSAAVNTPTNLLKHAPVYRVEVLDKFPHDISAFTQGLLFDNDYTSGDGAAKRGGILYESTGLYGESTIRRTELESGKVLEARNLSSEDFGEGLTLVDADGPLLLQVLWKVGKGFLYNRTTLQTVATFDTGLRDGWGVAQVAKGSSHFFLSDGTAVVRVFEVRASGEVHEVRRMTVRDGNTPVGLLNELEVINGELWANILLAKVIVRIDVDSGAVLGWLDLHHIADSELDVPEGHNVDVLNGIAYDEARDIVYVTGKLWPTMFAIRPVASPIARSVRDVVRNTFFLHMPTVQRVLDSM